MKSNSREIHWPLAVVDWGNTNLRGYLIAEDGSRLATFERAIDIKTLHEPDFRSIVDYLVEDWNRDYGCSSVILMGMAGSNLGWYDLPMLSAPVTWKMLADALFKIPETKNYNAFLIPGVAMIPKKGAPDMMRGEETQVLGALTLQNRSDGLFCLPGTHTKWVSTAGDAITTIRTSMTGEIYALLKGHSVLRSLLTSTNEEVSETDVEAFDNGIVVAKSGLGAMQLAFGVRVNHVLLGHTSPKSACSYLSGLLIGCEVLDCIKVMKNSDEAIQIVGNEKLGPLYQRAMTTFGVAAKVIKADDAVIAGAKWLYENHLYELN